MSSKDDPIDELYELEKNNNNFNFVWSKNRDFQRINSYFFRGRRRNNRKNKYVKSKVYEKIFLDLQQDEIEFANKEFRDLFDILMTEYQIKGFVSIEKIVPIYRANSVE